MGRLIIVVTDELEESFRAKAQNKFSNKKGAISKAASVAFKKWIDDND